MIQSLSGSKTCATLPSSVVWTPSCLALFDRLLLLLEASWYALFCWELRFWLWHPIPVAVVAAPVGVVVVAGGGGSMVVLFAAACRLLFGREMTLRVAGRSIPLGAIVEAFGLPRFYGIFHFDLLSRENR